MIQNVVIVGSGPAGHTAAIYTGRANLSPLMFEGFLAGGIAAGGQLTTTTEIENFPGFPKGIDGTELMNLIREQSLNSGCQIQTKTIKKVDVSQRPFKIYTEDNQEVLAHTLIVATGATAKRMNLLGEDKFWNQGISACAVCDGALPLFRDKLLMVIGGGDSAAEEASFLTKFASKVYLVVRRGELRASKVMAERVKENSKIEILWNTEALEVLGNQFLEQVKILNNQTQEESFMNVSGLFYAIGHTPNTGFLDNQIELESNGYIKTEKGSTKTSIRGVFVAGDVQDSHYRQAITSAGSGCMAAMDAEHYIFSNNLITK